MLGRCRKKKSLTYNGLYSQTSREIEEEEDGMCTILTSTVLIHLKISSSYYAIPLRKLMMRTPNRTLKMQIAIQPNHSRIQPCLFPIDILHFMLPSISKRSISLYVQSSELFLFFHLIPQC